MKRTIGKYFRTTVVFLAALLVTGIWATGSPAADKGVLDTIKANGKIRVAVFGDKPPFGYLDENGKNAGFDIVIAKRVVKDLLGNENAVEWVLLEPANRVDYLESNKVDIVFANFTVTKARAERVDFALPYMKVAMASCPRTAASSGTFRS
jgi:polar amino acid transport system substrate-binding protein